MTSECARYRIKSRWGVRVFALCNSYSATFLESHSVGGERNTDKAKKQPPPPQKKNNKQTNKQTKNKTKTKQTRFAVSFQLVLFRSLFHQLFPASKMAKTAQQMSTL